MTDRIRIPRRFNTPIRLFGRFTPRDLLRIGLPVLPAAVLLEPQPTPENLAGAAAAAITATAWYLVRPAGKHLDHHLYQSLRYAASHLLSPAAEDVDTDETYVETGERAVVGVVQVEPTNIDMKTSEEQRALHAVYRELLASVTYPIQIHSRQKPLEFDDYIDTIDTPDRHRNNLREGYLRLLKQIRNSGHTHTQHYITVRVNPSEQDTIRSRFSDEPGTKQEQQVDELDQRISEVVETLDTSELTAHRLTGEQLNAAVQDFQDPKPRTTTQYNSREEDGVGEYSKTLVVSDLPADLDIGWTLNLLRSDAQVDITQVIQPCQPGDATQKLNRVTERLQAEIDSLLRQGYLGTNKLESTLEDAEWMLNLLADREDNPVHYAAYITVHSPDREACEQALEQVQNRCNTMRIGTRRPVLRTDHALATWQPLQPDKLEDTQLMPAGSAAAGFPFGTQSIDQSRGVLHGTDTSDQTPVILDRFQWSSHSMARMGMVGSGKSYAAKLEILRSHLAYPDLDIYIVDPKKEYGDVVRALHGQSFTLTPGETCLGDLPIHTSEVVGFQVQNRGQRENTELLADTVEHLYQEVSKDTTPTLVVIDEARILMNDDQGKQLLNQFVLEGRDTNTAVTLVSQNASHFTYCREGREILDNMPGKVFMKHDRVPDSVVEYFDLSTREKQQLHQLRTGTDASYSEAIVQVSGQLDTKIRIESTPEEHGLIDGGRR